MGLMKASLTQDTIENDRDDDRDNDQDDEGLESIDMPLYALCTAMTVILPSEYRCLDPRPDPCRLPSLSRSSSRSSSDTLDWQVC